MDLDDLKPVLGTLGIVGCVGILGTVIGVSMYNTAKYEEGIKIFAEKVSDRVYEDLMEDGTFQFEKDNITYSFMSCETEKNMFVKKNEGSRLTTYGTITDAVDTQTGEKSNKSFKAEYAINISNLDKRKGIEELNNNFDEYFVFDNVEYNDEYALTYGFTNDEEISQFKNTLELRHKLEKSSSFSDIDILIPVYSKAEIVEKDGQRFAQLQLTGVQGKVEKKRNAAAGVAFGLFAYNKASSSKTYSNYAIPIAVTTGMVASNVFKSKEIDSRFFTETYELPIGNMEFSSESELRKYMIDELNDGKDMYYTLDGWSYNLSDSSVNKALNKDVIMEE